MKTAYFVILALITATLSNPAFGDSCLTSTDFWRAYKDLPVVEAAAKSEKIDESIATYLADPNNSIETKIAVCNALGWSFDGKNNHLILLRHFGLDSEEGKIIRASDLVKLSPDELLCVGYLMAMDNYFYPQRAIELVVKASERIPQSYTAQMVQTLVLGQIEQEGNNWCEIWRLFEDVDYQFPVEHRDMRNEARVIIMDYLSLYKGNCPGERKQI